MDQSNTGAAVTTAATAGVAVAEALVPGLLAFNPLFAIMLTAIRAHYNATGTWPTEAEILAAVPDEVKGIFDTWKSWVPSGDGTLPGPVAPVPLSFGR